jgi:hypothetical protein
MKIEQSDIAIASRIKTALEQGAGASNVIHIAAQIAASHRIAERDRCAGIVGLYLMSEHGDDLVKIIRNETEGTDNA